MAILRGQNKNTDFLMLLARSCRFKFTLFDDEYIIIDNIIYLPIYNYTIPHNSLHYT